MAGRRILLFVTLLLLIGVMASAIAPRQEQLGQAPPEPTAPPPQPSANLVEVSMPKQRQARAHVGDVVRLLVRHRGRDEVQIVALGLSEPVEAGLPAEVIFDADHPGRFAVTLRDAARRIGTVEVLPGE